MSILSRDEKKANGQPTRTGSGRNAHARCSHTGGLRCCPGDRQPLLVKTPGDSGRPPSRVSSCALQQKGSVDLVGTARGSNSGGWRGCQIPKAGGGGAAPVQQSQGWGQGTTSLHSVLWATRWSPSSSLVTGTSAPAGHRVPLVSQCAVTTAGPRLQVLSQKTVSGALRPRAKLGQDPGCSLPTLPRRPSCVVQPASQTSCVATIGDDVTGFRPTDSALRKLPVTPPRESRPQGSLLTAASRGPPVSRLQTLITAPRRELGFEGPGEQWSQCRCPAFETLEGADQEESLAFGVLTRGPCSRPLPGEPACPRAGPGAGQSPSVPWETLFPGA